MPSGNMRVLRIGGFELKLLAIGLLCACLQACAVVSATAGAAISVTGAVISTGVSVTGKVIEAGIDAASDDD